MVVMLGEWLGKVLKAHKCSEGTNPLNDLKANFLILSVLTQWDH